LGQSPRRSIGPVIFSHPASPLEVRRPAQATKAFRARALTRAITLRPRRVIVFDTNHSGPSGIYVNICKAFCRILSRFVGPRSASRRRPSAKVSNRHIKRQSVALRRSALTA
jgi:hypothetical protein